MTYFRKYTIEFNKIVFVLIDLDLKLKLKVGPITYIKMNMIHEFLQEHWFLKVDCCNIFCQKTVRGRANMECSSDCHINDIGLSKKSFYISL